MNVRWRPPSLQNGCSAFTTPAPCVQRLPTPPARLTTATWPVFKASRPSVAQLVKLLCTRSGQIEHVARLHIADIAVDGQAVLRQADAPGAQVGRESARAACGRSRRLPAAPAATAPLLLAPSAVPVRATAGRRAPAPCRPAPAATRGGGEHAQLGLARGRELAPVQAHQVGHHHAHSSQAGISGGRAAPLLPVPLLTR